MMRLVSTISLLLVLIGLATVPGFALQTASGSAQCPSIVRVVGSTTVGPIAAGEEAPFESAWPGTDVQVTQNGSGNGIIAINAGNAEVGMSSRPLTIGAGSESEFLYTYIVGRDGLMIAVKNDANMAFLTNITIAQLRDIYSGVLTNWNQFPGGPNQTIVPRARITASGSQPDFLRLTGTNSALEAATINATGLPRLTLSLDMANVAAANDYQIAYTSLADIDISGVKFIAVEGVPGTLANVTNNSYPLPRNLRMMTQDIAHQNRIDNTPVVHGDDIINFTYTSLGQSLIANEGFVPLIPPSVQPVPDWDVNMDGNTNIGDLGAITGKWGLTQSCKGWIRADANNNGTVSLGDIGVVTGKWGNAGFGAPPYAGD